MRFWVRIKSAINHDRISTKKKGIVDHLDQLIGFNLARRNAKQSY